MADTFAEATRTAVEPDSKSESVLSSTWRGVKSLFSCALSSDTVC